jgi:LPXTG-motif cell wall-anchored protein
MSIKIRAMIVVAVVGLFGLVSGAAFAQVANLPGMGGADEAVGGGLEAPAVGELGDTSHGPCVKQLLDLPAIGACEDADGKVIMDLPALLLVGPKAEGVPTKLPETGVNVGDLAGLGLAALTAGGVLLRRMRLSVAR